jgi:uncharacterized protein YegP (UPF0339 family)
MISFEITIDKDNYFKFNFEIEDLNNKIKNKTEDLQSKDIILTK